jgi:hypothetical protein
MTFTGERGLLWASEPRRSTLVFIGEAPLPRAAIEKGIRSCLAKK